MNLSVKISIIALMQIMLLSQGVFLISHAEEPPRGDGYARIINTKVLNTSDKFLYLRRYYTRAQSCYVDASVGAIQYFFDKKMSGVLLPEEMSPVSEGISSDCLKLSTTMKTDLYFTQYQICSALAKSSGSDDNFGICEDLGKKGSTEDEVSAYAFEYTDEERAAVKKSVSDLRAKKTETLKTAKEASPPEILIPDDENPLSILRFRLFYETKAYLNALNLLSTTAPLEGAAKAGSTNTSISVQGVNYGALTAQENEMVSKVNDNLLEWYQEFFLTYPQHLQYRYISKQFQKTTEEFDRIARVMTQLRYKLPNSSVDGDKNKGK